MWEHFPLSDRIGYYFGRAVGSFPRSSYCKVTTGAGNEKKWEEKPVSPRCQGRDAVLKHTQISKLGSSFGKKHEGIWTSDVKHSKQNMHLIAVQTRSGFQTWWKQLQLLLTSEVSWATQISSLKSHLIVMPTSLRTLVASVTVRKSEGKKSVLWKTVEEATKELSPKAKLSIYQAIYVHTLLWSWAYKRPKWGSSVGGLG